MKQNLQKIISCIIVLVIICCVMIQCTKIAQNKGSYYKTAPFFRHSEDFDVLFLGTSHVKLGILPMELWNDYGITSYNFGCSSSRLPTSYWILENALDYSSPKAVVIDCWGLGVPAKTDSSFEFVHEAFDAFPLTGTKIRSAFDLLNDPELQTYDTGEAKEKPTILGLLWNYSVYHNRWNSIGRSDFEPETTNGYGGELRPMISRPSDLSGNSGTKLSDINSTGIVYLERLIEQCKERDIDVILTYLPYCITSERDWEEINTIYDIADKYDIGYINFFENEIIDYDTDLADYTHLNPLGAWKVTDYMGDYLTSNYELKDHRNDPRYEHWNQDYIDYSGLKSDKINASSDLNTYLMLLSDKNLGYKISIGDSEILNDRITCDLLKNKGIDPEKELSTDNPGKIIVQSYKSDDPYTIIDTSVFSRPQNISIPEEYSDRYATRYDEHDGKLSIVYFELYNPDNVLNTVTVSIPQSIGFEDNLPNIQGIVFQNSMAVRVLQ